MIILLINSYGDIHLDPGIQALSGNNDPTDHSPSSWYNFGSGITKSPNVTNIIKRQVSMLKSTHLRHGAS